MMQAADARRGGDDFGSGDPRTPAKQSYRYCEVAAT